MDRTKGFLDEGIETRSWEEQRAGQAERLREIVAHAYANAPAVKAKFDEVGAGPGDIRTLEDLARIPVTPKAKLVEMQQKDPPFGGLLAVPLTEVSRVFRSPGPIYDPQGKGEGWGWEEAFFAAGFRPGDVSINTFSYHMTPAGMMFDDALQNLGCPTVPTGVGDRETQLEIMQRVGVQGFVGMASFLLQIGEKAREMGLDPRNDLSLETAFVTAEPLPDSLRNQVQDLFGCVLRQGYGTADCGCVAYECYHTGGMHLVRRAIVEIVDPTTGQPMADGETGEVVVTLFNRAYPLIRFGTGDLSAIDPGECACGRRSPKLRGWLGRADQLIKVKGMFVHPGQLQTALGGIEGAGRFRAVVTRVDSRDQLTVKVEIAGGGDEALRSATEARLRDVLRIGAAVEWVEPGSLPDDGRVVEDARTWD